MRKKAFDLETDPKVKAKLKLREAQGFGGSRGRALAYEALKYNPNLGKAYLYIASLYAKSANSCGKDEFEIHHVVVKIAEKSGVLGLVSKVHLPSLNQGLILCTGVENATPWTLQVSR